MDRVILQRYVEGHASDEETAEVVAWLDEDEAHVKEYLNLHTLHNMLLFREYSSEIPTQKHVRPTQRLRRLGWSLAKIASVIIIMVIVWHYAKSPQAEQQAIAWYTMRAPSGQRAELYLPDSTKVWLNAQSSLSFPNQFQSDRREVRLDGEAYFEVYADKAHPFIVHTPAMSVTATGTSFNITSYSGSDQFAVALLKGSVSVRVEQSMDSCLLKPNQYAEWYNQELHISPITDMNYFRWREGLICFDNESVGSIIKKLELYYDITIAVSPDHKLLQTHYTGKFRTKDGIEQVLKVLQLEHRFTYVKDNETNCITIH